MQLNESQERYWQKNLNITAILLAIWFVVTFVVAYFARDLSFTFFGWPFSFWGGGARRLGRVRADHRFLRHLHGASGSRAWCC